MDEQRYPTWICKSCGEQHGRRPVGIATWHAGHCDLCGETAFVTEPRDFGGLKTTWCVPPALVPPNYRYAFDETIDAAMKDTDHD